MKNTFKLSAILIGCMTACSGIKALAQENNKKPENKKSYLHIIIEKDENGKTISTDTVLWDESGIGKGFAFEFDPDGLPDPGEFKIFSDSDFAFTLPDQILNDEAKEKFKEEFDKMRGDLKIQIEDLRHLKSDELKKELDALQKEIDQMKQELNKQHPEKNKSGKTIMFHMNDTTGSCSGKAIKCMVFSPDSSRMVCLNLSKHEQPGGLKEEKKISVRKIIVAKGQEPVTQPDEITGDSALRNEDDTTLPKQKRNSDAKGTLEISDLKFYPNPGDGKFMLEFSLSTPGEAVIQILDYTGKIILNEKHSGFPGTFSKQFDISGKSKGSYLLKISQGEKWMHEKMVVR